MLTHYSFPDGVIVSLFVYSNASIIAISIEILLVFVGGSIVVACECLIIIYSIVGVFVGIIVLLLVQLQISSFFSIYNYF